MRKWIAMLLAVGMVCSLTACGSGKTSTDTSDTSANETNSSRTTLNVGFDAEYPPYGYMNDNGEYVGFDLDLAQAVCDMEGWKLIKTPINWNSKDMELNSGSIDCIWNGFTINGREDDYTWSIPYVDNSQVMVVAKNSGMKSLSDLAGKTVGVQKASAALDLLNGDQKKLADTFGTLQQFDNYNNAFVELQSGSIDALAMDIGVANYQLKSRGKDYEILGEKLNSEQYGVGFKKGNTELRDIVNKDLQKLTDDGTVSKLADKYDISDLICLESDSDSNS